MSDYIERQKVKDIRFSGGINHDGFLYVPYKELVDGIKALPSADVVQVEVLKAEIYKLKHQREQGFGNHDYYVGYISALSTVEGILAWMDEKE